MNPQKTKTQEQLSELEAVYVEERVFTIPNDGTTRCVLHDYHSPEVASFDVHHMRPKAKDGSDDESNLAVVCPTGHRNVHILIRLMDKIGLEPIDETSWGRATWEMALKGTDAR